MTPPRVPFELRCRLCAWREVCGPDAMIAWLTKAGKLRRGSEPETEILQPLFLAAVPQLDCPKCGQRSLAAARAEEDRAEWPDVVPCAACSKPIPPERLQAVPEATLCAACQQAEESGNPRVEVEYCPKCGAPMQLRPVRGSGITRYRMACTGNPPCRR